MEITKLKDGATCTLKLEGWLDTSTAPDLSKAIEEVGPDVRHLVFDFTGLQYISSAGLRLLVAAHKKMAGNLEVKNVSSEVMGVLHMAGMDKRLNIS